MTIKQAHLLEKGNQVIVSTGVITQILTVDRVVVIPLSGVRIYIEDTDPNNKDLYVEPHNCELYGHTNK
jgi:hypothetical protein